MIIDRDWLFILEESCLVGFKIGVEKWKKIEKKSKMPKPERLQTQIQKMIFHFHSWAVFNRA